MLILVPVLLPVITAMAILALQRARPGFGLSFFLAILVSLANWALLLWFRWNPPPPIAMANWLPFPGVNGALIFQLDQWSWPYAFSIASLAVGVLFTASARLTSRSIPAAWSGTLLVYGAALLAIMAGSPIALALAWMMIDAIELGLILGTVNGTRLSRQAVLSFSARILGIFFLLVAMGVSTNRQQVLIIIDPPVEAGVFLLIAAGLRLGVLPLHLPYTEEVPLRRGLGTFLRLASPATSLALLSHLPASVVPPDLSPYLLLFASLAGLYGAGMWLASDSEINARPYWLISLAGMAIGSVIRGYPVASLAWGTAMILSGGTLFLANARQLRRIRIPLWLALLALSGLPFTPSASGWSGLVIPPINLPDFIFLAAHAMLIAGFIRHVLRPGDTLSTMERWIQVIYPAGLLFMPLAAGINTVFGWTNSLTPGVWWSSILSVLLAVGGWVLYVRILRPQMGLAGGTGPWYLVLGQRVGRVLSAVLRLNWLYSVLSAIYTLFKSLIQSLTAVLEGEGGVLWVLVLLALLISLFLAGGAP